MTRDTGSVDGAAIAAAKFDASGWGHHRSAVTDACAIVAFVPCACSSPSVSAEDGLWTGAETCWTSSDASLVPGLGNRTVWSRVLSSRSASAFNAARHSRFPPWFRSEEHTSELQSQSNLVCRLLLEKKKNRNK